MSRPLLLIIAISPLLPVLTGCSAWNVGSSFPHGEPVEQSLSQELLDALSEELKQDLWRSNPAWSVEKQHNPDEHRRLFGNRAIEKVLNRVDALPVEQASASRVEQKAQNPEAAESSMRPGSRYLLALAQRDDLSGWNAAILLARREPQVAGEITDILERLVSSPSHYDPQTKQRVADPKTPSRFSTLESDAGAPFSESNTQPEDSNEIESAPEDSTEDREDSQQDEQKSISEKVLAEELARELAGNPGHAPSEKPSGLKAVWNRFRKEEPAETQQQSIPSAISQSMRAAAAEAWCRVLAAGSTDPLEGLAPAGRLLSQTEAGEQLRDSPAAGLLARTGHGFLPDTVRGELYRGIACWISPSRIPTLEQVMWGMDDEERPSIVLRKAAIESCLIYAQSLQSPSTEINSAVRNRRVTYDASFWPTNALNLQFDPDPSIRRMLGRWAALVDHPQSLPLLESQLMDKEFKVRDSALIALGILGSEEARLLLHQQAQRSEERVRAWAVKGLARWGPGEIQPFLTDESFQVRQALAEELAGHADISATLLLRELLVDSHGQVQTAAVNALREWPDELALPLLLHGLRDSSPATRVKCFSQLRQRTNLQMQFPVEAAFPKRAEAAVDLARKLNLSSGHLQQLLREGLQETDPRVSRLQVDEIKTQIRTLVENPPHTRIFGDALAGLKQLTKAEVPAIERILLEVPQPHPEVFYSELLPSLSPAYAALEQMKSPDVRHRRRGAQTLAELGARASLSRPVAQRLHAVLTQEQDRLVWRYAMLAVTEDATDESDQIALLALNHSIADVRLLGCRYLARHGKPQYALWILNLDLFSDSNKEVKLSSVEAAGLCRNTIVLDGLPHPLSGNGIPPKAAVKPSRGLRPLLNDSDQRIRHAVTIAMSRLGDPQGTQELIRLSYQPDVALRRQIVEQMGETGRTLFVEHLIRMAWTESSLPVKRAILNSLNQLIPAENRPVGLADQTGSDDKIKLWVDWWERKHRPGFPSPRTGLAASD